MNTDAPWPDLYEAEAWVLNIHAKLHQWAVDEPRRRFDDLFNLVADPAFLVVAWDRVRNNRGARSKGVDGVVLPGPVPALPPRAPRRPWPRPAGLATL